jgi:hypothetical protein
VTEPHIVALRGSATDEEAVAVAAAIELLWPRPTVILEAPRPVPAWRFSARWWARPVAARRDRPFFR